MREVEEWERVVEVREAEGEGGDREAAVGLSDRSSSFSSRHAVKRKIQIERK